MVRPFHLLKNGYQVILELAWLFVAMHAFHENRTLTNKQAFSDAFISLAFLKGLNSMFCVFAGI